VNEEEKTPTPDGGEPPIFATPPSEPSPLPQAPTAPPSEHEEWKFQDPDRSPGRKGMLLSNEIHRFCQRRLLIEQHYEEKRLRPAAYTLTIGDEIVDSSGKPGRLTDKKPSFDMKPNSIVYVTTREKLNLPYYVVARFNLRVKWVYKGILLGTGPQVEPGYRGFLSCPLYNLTNQPMRIRRGEEFATIDFERTTDFCKLKPKSEVEPLIKTGEKLDQVVVDGEKFLLFKQNPYEPLHHFPDYNIVSSLVQMQKEVRTWRYIGIGTVIAFIALALSLIGLQVRIEGSLLSTAGNLNKAEATIKQITDASAVTGSTVQGMHKDVNDLNARVAAIEHKLSHPGPRRPQAP
jgi:deoxycytidine triphosphate deaminase